MPRGGARTGSGPAPELNALRREYDQRTWTRLPKECTRPVPDWPLEVPDPTVVELAMWDRIWKQPQAHVWHADHLTDSVALYVRTFIEAARADASTQRRITTRQMADALLLTTPALRAQRYVITGSPEDEILASAQARATGTDGRRSARPGRQTTARERMGVTVIAGGQSPDEGSPEDEGEDGDDA